MDTIYITAENATVHRSEQHLIVRKEGRLIGTVPLAGVQSVVLFGPVQMTAQAQDLLLGKGIDTILATALGKVKGRVYAAKGSGIIVRLAQYEAFRDREHKLRIAKSIVAGKILNQRRLIERYRKNYSAEQYSAALADLKRFAGQAADSADTNQLLGVEGVSAKYYWDCFRRLLQRDKFVRRDFRPAPDYINSALNLGYTFLCNEITVALNAANFETGFGFLHSLREGRPTLALDIMEEYRAPFIDSWLLAKFNRRELKSEHFQGADKGFYLNKEGFAKYCELYHKHLDEGGWRKHFRESAARLKKAVIEDAPYVPFQYV